MTRSTSRPDPRHACEGASERALSEPDPASLPLSTALLEEIRAEFPAFRIVPKRGDRLSRVIDWALRCVTLGGQRHYLTHYHTVLGFRLYVPDSWYRLDDVGRTILLRHERVHLRQRRRYGFVPMALLYLLPIFPIGLALGRARIEWEAYTETLRATAELLGIEAARAPNLREHILGRFTGPDYGWMWPFRGQLERWYDAALARIAEELADTVRGGEPLGASR